MWRARLLKDDMRQGWEDFFAATEHGREVGQMLDTSDARSLVIDWRDVDAREAELAVDLLERPKEHLACARRTLSEYAPPEMAEEAAKIEIHFINVPDVVPISKIRAEQVRRLFATDGLVRRVTQVEFVPTSAVFECTRCKETFEVPQNNSPYLQEPMECQVCKKPASKTVFEFLRDESPHVNSQKVEIQEHIDNIDIGVEPSRLVLWAFEENIGKVRPGDRVRVNGILMNVEVEGRRAKKVAKQYLHVSSYQLGERMYEEVEITDEDEKEILKVSEDPELWANLQASLAPTLFGMEVEKQVGLLQLFGGVRKEMPDGTYKRGDIHGLLVGDPGTAKSAFGRALVAFSPRAMFAAGGGSTGPGLLAAATKDEFGEGRWTLEAGPMVLCSGNGLLVIDEFEKMNPKDRDQIHPAMEQQVVDVAKAGISTKLPAVTSILALANPAEGRFDPEDYIFSQIKLSSTLLSRFDYILPVMDKPEPKRDENMAAHITGSHRLGGQNASRGMGGDISDLDDLDTDAYDPHYSSEFMRKYVAYAKRIVPVLSPEAERTINDFYVNIRRSSASEGSVAITPRQLEGLIRLAEASARSRLSNRIEVRDAERSITITKHWLALVSSESGGLYDIDIITSGTSHSMRQRMKIVRTLIDGMSGDDDNSWELAELITRAEEEGMEEKEIQRCVKRLHEEGSIYEILKDSGRYRVTHQA